MIFGAPPRQHNTLLMLSISFTVHGLEAQNKVIIQNPPLFLVTFCCNWATPVTWTCELLIKMRSLPDHSSKEHPRSMLLHVVFLRQYRNSPIKEVGIFNFLHCPTSVIMRSNTWKSFLTHPAALHSTFYVCKKSHIKYPLRAVIC